MENKEDNIILISGGLDSIAAYFFMKRYIEQRDKNCNNSKLKLVYFNLNTPYTSAEIRFLRKFERENNVEIIYDNNLKFLGNYEYGQKAFVPHRNLLLATYATYHSEQSNKVNICIAGLKDDVAPDKNKEIFRVFSALLTKTGDRSIQIYSPFWDNTKDEIVEFMAKMIYNNEKDPFKAVDEKTFSCYNPEGLKPCLSCPACFRKNTALFANGYMKPFYNLSLANEYKTAAVSGKYDEKRNRNIIEYVNKLIK